ncbi:hypothetical protein CHCC15381_1561 [Bacillus paralicheniformis]|uniref:Uncharacterized protein n=1 Tax=Bacillus paralicheniformis TaxID=1648923 RepID=A0ABY3FXD8_9BACI|nr:hypothetical protein CHCC4186_4002 [Bacillus paralicheniformis]TWL40189.1 hypothetical protein CHCC15381_1561 [Bacillus paralicheniformis]
MIRMGSLFSIRTFWRAGGLKHCLYSEIMKKETGQQGG